MQSIAAIFNFVVVAISFSFADCETTREYYSDFEDRTGRLVKWVAIAR